ncbi:MAG: tyrosine--tRNA ligase [Candidatus Pacebacteria bacterium]|nr:tyrosine--tRNA ligase [Candidatus Paceibacterota bacterium]
MNTDEQIGTLLTKAVQEVLPSKEFLLTKLNSDKRLTIYAGFDPTAPTLHIGHSVSLRKLRQFQDLGHKVIFLVGDFTARIGDPTDKSAARKQLTEKEIKTNLKLYKKQAEKFIRFSGKNKAEIKFNSSWLGKLKFADIIELASHMTVDQMLKRDMFVRRNEEEKPIYLHEFFYPLMQGYDSVAMEVDGEVGGNDQLFNMMTGRTLLKQIKNKEKFVITNKLLEDGSGKKMGKTEGNMVSLLDSPEDMYGKIMSWVDGLIVPGFELCTDYTPKEVEEIKKILEEGKNPRDLKMKLAFEITNICHDKNKAQKAQDFFIGAFQKKEIPDEILEVRPESDLGQTFIKSKLIVSNSELRRLIESGAVTHLESGKTISLDDIKKVPEKGTYKIGKNRFIKII